MSGNVFEQYQKYFESVITRHKVACQQEIQNHSNEGQPQQQLPQQSLQPPQPTLQPPQQQPQQLPELQPQPTQQPPQQIQQPPPQPQQQLLLPQSPQPLPQDPTAQDFRRQQMLTSANYAYWQPYGAELYGMATQPGYNAVPDCSYYMCLNSSQQPQKQQFAQRKYQQQQLAQPYYQQQQLSQPYYQKQHFPCNLLANPGFRQQPAADAAVPVVAVDSTFQPDRPAEAAEKDETTNKKQTFYYPNSVSGFQGGTPCGLCISCKVTPPAILKAAVQQQQRLQEQQPGQRGQQQRLQEQQIGERGLKHGLHELQHRQRGQPCEGGKDCSGWSAADDGSGANVHLPLGADEPFVVGPTTYQYFFDPPA